MSTMSLRFRAYLFFVVVLSCAASSESLVKRDNAQPVVAVPSQHWEGNDGLWSTFEIRVGTPPQQFRVLPSTSWQETWVVGAYTSNCDVEAGQTANCITDGSRGGAFSLAASLTWHDEGQYELGLNNILGYEGEGVYGLDTVGLGWSNDTGLELPQQIVAAIISDQYLFGILGMGFQPSNLTDYATPKASFSSSLYSNGTIPSMSWSYTAGAYYQLKGVFGSLIFGGMDITRFKPNDVVFTMTGDNLRDIVPTIRSINSTSNGQTTTLMSTPEFAFIDSTVPEFWLPVAVCQEFEKAFGLQLDTATGYYFVNSSTHDNLVTANPNITITLANQKTGGATVDIVLPYAAFDHNLSAPLYPNGSTYYFPLKQGQNDSQYTLGRTFLQEAYVTADYNNRQFNVSQALFLDGVLSQIVPIPSNMPNATTGSNSSNSTKASTHKLSTGAIVGIVIGCVAIILLLGALIFFCLRRRRGDKPTRASTVNTASKPPSITEEPHYEIDSSKRYDPDDSAYTAQASAYTANLQHNSPAHEIGGNPIMHPQELEAEVPAAIGLNRYGDRRGEQSKLESESSSSPQARQSTTVSSQSNSPLQDRAEIIGRGGIGTLNSSERSDRSPRQEIISPVSDEGRATFDR